MITTRPYAIHQLDILADVYEIYGLSDGGVLLYGEKFFTKTDITGFDFHRHISRKRGTQLLVKIPLMLGMVTWLAVEKGIEFLNLSNRASLYDDLVTSMYHKMFKNGTRIAVDEEISIDLNIFLPLCRFAYEKLLQNQLIFTRKEILEAQVDEKFLASDFLRFDILTSVYRSNSKIAFPHATIQDYLAAIYVNSLPDDEKETNFNHLCPKGDAMKLQTREHFLYFLASKEPEIVNHYCKPGNFF